MKIFVVEDEAIIAMNMQDLLEDMGHVVVGPAGSVAAALDMIAGGAAIDCALLDVNLRGEAVYPVAAELEARGVPFAFTSGYGARGIDPRFAARIVLAKPVDEAKLTLFLQETMGGAAGRF